MALPMLPRDKANHFVYGAAVCSLSAALVDPMFGLFACAFFAIGKELVDLFSGKGTPEIFDALATLLGGVAVVTPCLIG